MAAWTRALSLACLKGSPIAVFEMGASVSPMDIVFIIANRWGYFAGTVPTRPGSQRRVPESALQVSVDSFSPGLGATSGFSSDKARPACRHALRAQVRRLEEQQLHDALLLRRRGYLRDERLVSVPGRQPAVHAAVGNTHSGGRRSRQRPIDTFQQHQWHRSERRRGTARNHGWRCRRGNAWRRLARCAGVGGLGAPEEDSRAAGCEHHARGLAAWVRGSWRGCRAWRVEACGEPTSRPSRLPPTSRPSRLPCGEPTSRPSRLPIVGIGRTRTCSC